MCKKLSEKAWLDNKIRWRSKAYLDLGHQSFRRSFNLLGLFDLWDFLMNNPLVVPPVRHIYMLSLVLWTAQDLLYFVLFGLLFE